jgi:alpha-ribazole phosphatase
MKLWLVRHARVLVEPGVCYGAMNVAADQAATIDAATVLAAQLPLGLSVVCSPLQRCTQLAGALHGLRPDLSWRVDARLREMDFGRWEGWSWSDIGQDAFGPWMAEFHHHRFGGSESVGELMDRVEHALKELAPDSEDVWITHAGVIRAVSLLIRGTGRIQSPDQWPSEIVPLGAAQCLRW